MGFSSQHSFSVVSMFCGLHRFSFTLQDSTHVTDKNEFELQDVAAPEESIESIVHSSDVGGSTFFWQTRK